MSESEQTDSGGQQYDAPNQEVVGVGHPSEEGTGATGGATMEQQRGGETSLDEMTKDELLEYAQRLGVKPANAAMTKDELRAGIDAHQGTAAAS